MRVEYPSAAHGTRQTTSVTVHDAYKVDGLANIQNDVLLFELSNVAGFTATCRVDLSDVGVNGFLAGGAVAWEFGADGKKYIEFSEFPRDEDGSPEGTPMTSCSYVVTLTKDQESSEAADVWMNIYSG